jgi:hypothetical protein
MSQTTKNQDVQIRILPNPHINGAECNANSLSLGYTLRDTSGQLWSVTSEISLRPYSCGDWTRVWKEVDESEWTTIEHKPILTHVVDRQWKIGGKTQAPGIINRY